MNEKHKTQLPICFVFVRAVQRVRDTFIPNFCIYLIKAQKEIHIQFYENPI